MSALWLSPVTDLGFKYPSRSVCLFAYVSSLLVVMYKAARLWDLSSILGLVVLCLKGLMIMFNSQVHLTSLLFFGTSP